MKYFKTILTLFVIALFCVSITANAQKTFAYTGSMQTWTVPCNVTIVTIDCYGAQGVPKPNENHPGFGGEARGVLNVIPGQVLNIFVGGQIGWNGGGIGENSANGGDASDVRIGGTGLANRVIVAGGGGGSAGDNWGCLSGVNGNGGGGTAVGTNFVGGGGGLGYGGCGSNGASAGGAGYNGGNCHGGGGGGGGETSGGGGATAACGPYTSSNGVLGSGGAAYVAPLCASEGAGGGGGGYYGGGGACGYNCGAGEGGGGSSWTGTLTSPYFNQGVWIGNGQVIITYNNVNLPVTDTGFVLANEVTCNGKTGKAYAKVTGAAISYLWSPGGQTTDTATGLGAGTYTISLSNPCGASASATVTITQPVNAITATATVIANAFCAGVKDGQASATGIGVGTPYAYTWNPSGETSAIATGLGAATYTVTVTNACAATASATVTITQPAPLSVTASTTANVPCFGQNAGSTYSIANSGTPPFRYNWAPSGGTLDSAVGLTAATYTIILTDNNGCTGSAKTAVTQPAVLSTTNSIQNTVLCNGYKTGTIVTTTNGGTSPYAYKWTGGETTAVGSNLSAGTYTVSITDTHGCTTSAQSTLTQPTKVNAIQNSTLDSGSCTGSAWVVVTGGVLPYTYVWNNGNTTYYIPNQCGTKSYCCIITDGNVCSDTVCIEVYSVAGVGNVSAATGKIVVYPNPTSGQLTITSTIANDNSVVEVYNVLGEKVYSTNLNAKGGATTINIANQPNGIYLYRVMSSVNGTLEGQGKIVLTK